MQDVDVGSIVPSTRDLLQVIGTRKRSLALLGLLGEERPAEEAARLHELAVSALVFEEATAAMQLAARATKTVPSLCLAPAADRQAMLRARQEGADGVCIDAAMPLDDWDKLAKIARSMRMLPLALAADAAGVEAAVKAGARAIVLRANAADEIVAMAAAAPKSMTLVGWVPAAEAAAIRALAGHVDAAVVGGGLHAAPDFADLVAEVDP